MVQALPFVAFRNVLLMPRARRWGSSRTGGEADRAAVSSADKVRNEVLVREDHTLREGGYTRPALDSENNTISAAGMVRSNRDASAALLETALPAALPAQLGNLSDIEVNTPIEARELLAGFVHLRGVLPPESQQALLEIACAATARRRSESGESGGWYRRDPEAAAWRLNDGTKARYWDEIGAACGPQRAELVKRLGQQLAGLAAECFPQHLADPTRAFDARVIAFNYYTTRGRMNWHQDDTNFAKAERPIVMACLGLSADFGYREASARGKKGDGKRTGAEEKSVLLETGDAIVFGGPARDMAHALLRVHGGAAAESLSWPQPAVPGRVSITWRDVGPEDGLVFNSDERLGLRPGKHTLPRYR